MNQRIDAPVSVVFSSNHKTGVVQPRRILWSGKEYEVEKVGLYHTFRVGRILHHVFSVATDTLYFKLVLNSESLTWRLEEISDGMAQ